MGSGYGEHLLVWSWRRIVGGRGHCPVLAQEFADACGEDANEVLQAFSTFLKAWAFASRRQLVIGAPDAFAVSPDERRALTLLAAAQADQRCLLEAQLQWIASPDKRATLAIAAKAFATALSVNGIALALPACDRRPLRERKLEVA